MDNNAPVIDTKKNAAKFYKVVETYIKRDGINDLMDWLGSTDFFEAPASTRFHGSYEGGLCQHSLNVGKWLNKLAEGLYPGQYTKETRSWRLLRCRPFLERLRSGRQPPR